MPARLRPLATSARPAAPGRLPAGGRIRASAQLITAIPWPPREGRDIAGRWYSCGAWTATADLLPLVASTWPNGFLDVTLSASRLLPTGRYFLMPARPPFLITAEEPMIDLSSPDATSGFRLIVRTLASDVVDFRTAADGVTPRWVIKGGA